MLPRDAEGDAVRWFEIDPCYVFHTLNAYDDGDTVVVDVVRHPRMFDTVLTGPDEGPADAGRFTLDLATGHGARGRVRPALAGVPAPRRAAHRPPAPLRLRRRLRGRRARRHRAAPRPGRPAPPHVRSLGAGTRGERVLLRPRPATAPARTTGCCWATSSTAPRAAATCGVLDAVTPRGRRRRAPARAGAGRLPRQLGARGDRPGRRLTPYAGRRVRRARGGSARSGAP